MCPQSTVLLGSHTGHSILEGAEMGQTGPIGSCREICECCRRLLRPLGSHAVKITKSSVQLPSYSGQSIVPLMMLGYMTYFGQWEVSRDDVTRAFKYACVVCIGLLLSCWLL